jgi:cellulose biosynthesis protein BcsQ
MFEWLDVLRAMLGKGVVDLLGFVLLAIVGLISRAIWKWTKYGYEYSQRLNRARSAIARKTTPSGKVEGDGIWLTQPITGALSKEYVDGIAASKVLIVANAKGGVGKTTTVANIGARLAEVLTKPVLMIDLDFQGTLSSMSVAGVGWVPSPDSDSVASHLVSGELLPQLIAKTGLSAAGQPDLKIIPSFYDLAQAENRLMIEWLIGDVKDDVRFSLARILQSPAVRQAFSLIIIDCAPRFTTSTIQALAAGTHLLIPTIMDAPSTEAVVSFVRQVEAFKKGNLCPSIEYIGVAVSLQRPNVDIEFPLKDLEARLKEFQKPYGGGDLVSILTKDTFLPLSTRFSNAVSEGGIAYTVMGNDEDDRKVKDKIKALADHVRKEMNLK